MKNKIVLAIALLIPLSVMADGIRVTKTRTSDAAISQYAAVKASTTAGRVVMLGAGDSAALMTGVAQSSAGGSGVAIPIIELQGLQSTMLSDGTTSIAAGDLVQPSASVAGRIMKGTTSPIGTALSACSASLDCQVTVL